MKRWTEKRLVQRIVKGDPVACAELVDRHYEGIFGFVVHLCRDSQHAEDLTQETFVSCWMKIGGFSGSSSLATWLRRIAYRKFVDWYRRQKRLVQTQRYPQAYEFSAADIAGPLEAILADEQSKLLYEAVAKLDQQAREVIVLHYLQGLSYREMAVVLDESTGTLKWRTSKAMKSLQKMLNRSP